MPTPPKKRPTNSFPKIELTPEQDEERLRHHAIRQNGRDSEDRLLPLPFPVEVFPAKLGQLVVQIAKALPCPPDFIAVPMLAVAGSFVGAERPLQIKAGWVEPACLYTVTIADTGSKKSPAMGLALSPAHKRDEQLRAQFESKKRKNKLELVPPVCKQHVISNTTVEAMARVLADNRRGLLMHRDELTALVSSMNQYKGGKGDDRQFFLSAWSCEPHTFNRVGRDEPLYLERPFFSIVGNVPPQMLGELSDRKLREDGFIDRFLFAYPDPVPVRWTDESPDAELLTKWDEACLQIGKLPKATLTLSSAAVAEYADWVNEHNAEKPGSHGAWAKMDGYCARLASIVHHLRQAYGEIEAGDVVDVESVRRAVKLIDYFKNHCVRARGQVEAEKSTNKLARVIAFVAAKPDRRVRARELQMAKIAKDSAEAKAMLESLAEQGLGRMVEGRKKDEVIFEGRPNLEGMEAEFEEVLNR